jgi:hypothetical protein
MAEGVAEVTYIANFQVLVGRWYRQHQLPLPTPSTPTPYTIHLHTYTPPFCSSSPTAAATRPGPPSVDRLVN